jgi:NAD-dependent dihydropyrimidine dehydrogenase PreA subunit
MTSPSDTGQPRILFCSCAHYDIIPAATRERVLRAVTSARPEAPHVEVVADLCGLAANRDPRLKSWVQESPLTIVACFPRAIRWLFHAAGAPLPEDQARVLNMRTQTPDEIIRQLMIEEEHAPAASETNHLSSIIHHQSDWVPWFPVIDYDGCRNCKQCLNFCLFGVYALSAEGRVEVHRPAGCKTNCPACARMCPQKAIIFPKYADAPINGDEVPPATGDSSEDANPQSSDVYDRIRRHSTGRKRFSKSCPTIEGLRRELGIPEDVLASLSPAELQRIGAKSARDAGQSSTDGDKKAGGQDE